jgi:hypothetical protein
MPQSPPPKPAAGSFSLSALWHEIRCNYLPTQTHCLTRSAPEGSALIGLSEDSALTRNLSNGLTAVANSNTSNDEND